MRNKADPECSSSIETALITRTVRCSSIESHSYTTLDGKVIEAPAPKVAGDSFEFVVTSGQVSEAVVGDSSDSIQRGLPMRSCQREDDTGEQEYQEPEARHTTLRLRWGKSFVSSTFECVGHLEAFSGYCSEPS